MTTIEKAFFYLIIVQPLLDLMTSLMIFLQIPITIGALFRFTLIILLLFYMTYMFITKKQYDYFIILLSAHLTIGMTFIINFLMKAPFFTLAEINFSLKTSYFITFFLFACLLIQRKITIYHISSRAVPIVAIIIGSSFWLAIITKTNITSYTYEEIGYSGWFYSANELSSSVLILLSLTIIYLHHATKQQVLIHFIAFISILSMLQVIGTKTAFGGGLILLSLYTFYLIFFINRHKKTRFTLIYLSIIVLFLISIPFSPITATNQTVNIERGTENNGEVTNEIIHPFINKLLSSRDIYLQMTANDFYNAPLIRQLFGISYGGNYTKAPKLVEMDFFDLLFSYGYIGFLILVIPLIIIFQQSFIQKVAITSLLLQLAICLLFIISFLAGHVLFAPSVITYFTILFLQTAEIHEVRFNDP